MFDVRGLMFDVMNLEKETMKTGISKERRKAGKELNSVRFPEFLLS